MAILCVAMGVPSNPSIEDVPPSGESPPTSAARVAKVGEAPPAAIVLCAVVTGLATVRALAHEGVDVHAFIFDPHDPLRYSRYATKVVLDDRARDEEWLLQFLIVYARTVGNRPVILPTSDGHALFLARHRERLAVVSRTSEVSLAEFTGIIHKDGLEQSAKKARVPIIPSIDNATEDEIHEFTRDNPGPYLLKPVFQNAPDSTLRVKNLKLPDREALFDHARKHGLHDVVVQQLVLGGDGEIYDTYGLCDSDGDLVTIATHRRIRQYPRDLGTTSFGEIPAGLSDGDWVLLDQTRRLLAAIDYHGIFGIEWLHDIEKDRYCIIDFNARPFSSIGHLEACGLNLPYLAWRELAGEDLGDVALQPRLRHSLWIDFKRDLSRWRQLDADTREPLDEWAASAMKARSFAYFDWRDPGPFLRRVLETISPTERLSRMGRKWVASMTRRKPPT
jgi:predicted ATP-grasp superfamily ATP-dependent carboligase